MKIISWNVAGFRAVLKKGFDDFFRKIDADIFCIQESKVLEEQFDYRPEGYKMYLNPAEKKGYSGTLVFTRIDPINVSYGMGIEEHDKEGRIITLEYDKFYLVTVYTPNAKNDLSRLEYRMKWEDDFKSYLKMLELTKPVVVCGDLNVAHNEIDIKNAKSNRGSAGFTDEERDKFSKLLEAGFIDTFRYLYPEKIKYSWWSYMGHARENNTGWRIDYFVVSNNFIDKVNDSIIHDHILGSDHCPIEIDIED
jgi:exodeoxyribonuclease III